MMNWQSISEATLPATLSGWLADTGSLTDHCRQYFKDDYLFQLRNESWQLPNKLTCKLLKISTDEKIKVREITQGTDRHAFVYGRSVFTQAVLDDTELDLNHLGSTSLGTRIFQHPDLKRGTIFVKELAADDELYQQASNYFSNPIENLWARYSIFTLKHLDILVFEVFCI